MIGLYSNILVRVFARDDPAQEKAALRLIDGLPNGEKAIVNIVVVVELLWVLGRKYNFERNQLARVIRSLTEHRRLFLPDKDILREAAHRVTEEGGDLPDVIIGLLNKEQGASTTYTFDRDAASNATFTLVEA